MVSQMINELENLFNALNSKFYRGSLNMPIISIQRPITVKGYKVIAWFTNDKWKTKYEGEERIPEIVFSGEDIQFADIYDLCEYMLHEMVHYYNCILEIKEGDHNAAFRDTAESHGLICGDKDKKYGYAQTMLNEDTKKWIDDGGLSFIDLDAFCVGIVPDVKKERKKDPVKKYKYKCPICRKSFTIKQNIEGVCLDCNEPLVVQVIEPEEPKEDE